VGMGFFVFELMAMAERSYSRQGSGSIKDGIGMRKTVLVIAGVVFACFAMGMAEQTGWVNETGAASLAIARHSWDIGPEISHIKYEEPGVMEQDGTMIGVGLSYTYHSGGAESVFEGISEERQSDGGEMFRGDIRFSSGQVDYDGALQDGTLIQEDNVDDNLFEIRGLMGVDSFGVSSLSTLYIGLGYRYLNDDSSSDASGYERESNYLYMPVGVETSRAVDGGWVVGGTAEFDVFLWGHQTSDLRKFGEGVIENDQHSGYGFRASLRFEKDDFVIEPFIRYWNIDESDVDHGWVEPANETTEYGVKFVWRF